MARWLANDKYNTPLTAGYSASPADTTLSVGVVPANLPTIVVAGKGTTNETVFTVTGSSGGNTLTGVSRLRGANVDLAQGTSIECLNNEDFINQYQNALFDQQGLKLIYAADGGSTDAYAITLSPAITALSDIQGVPIVFRANTVNTGAATLSINGLAATSIKKNCNVTLDDGDIAAGQIVTVVYDGTNFQLISPVATLGNVTLTGTQTLTNKRITPRTDTVASSATPSINTDTTDFFTITALATAITSMTSGLTGTPTSGQKLVIRILDNGTARAINWGSSFASRGAALPTTTTANKYTYVGLIWNSTASKWDCVATATEA